MRTSPWRFLSGKYVPRRCFRKSPPISAPPAPTTSELPRPHSRLRYNPHLMGLDVLDITFRLEKRFAIKIYRGDLSPLFERRQPPDLAVGDLVPFLRDKLANPACAITQFPAPLTDHLERAIPCVTCDRNLRDLPRTA